MSLVEEGDDKKIRMAFLSIVCSHTVNGVAALHSDLLKKTIFKEFNEYYPNKIQNKTNGVAPRRWIHCCNRPLSDLISETIGSVDEWITTLGSLRQLSAHTKNPEFIEKFAAVKRQNKAKLQKWVKDQTGIDIPLDSLYDVQVKRIHEYKRQLLNILFALYRYL
jgi:starch phosphorylase